MAARRMRGRRMALWGERRRMQGSKGCKEEDEREEEEECWVREEERESSRRERVKRFLF